MNCPFCDAPDDMIEKEAVFEYSTDYKSGKTDIIRSTDYYCLRCEEYFFYSPSDGYIKK